MSNCTVCRPGCPRRHHRGCRGRARRRGSFSRDHPEPLGIGSQTDSQAGSGAPSASLLRSLGPTGYVLYWQLTQLGVAVRGDCSQSGSDQGRGDRVKTDRRDAEKLARCHRSRAKLTAVWVPDADHEGDERDLVQAREAGEKKDQLKKARHRLGEGTVAARPQAGGIKAWTVRYLEWIKTHVHFSQPALEATLADYLEEVDHVAARIVKLEKAIDDAVQQA